ncbi:MAG TPA: Crp/Fnr family transcriptional regulator [Candidatus Binatia bacterium]|jgi:CRP-like cAMP-binding protein
MADNLLLAALSRKERERLRQYLETVELRPLDILIEANKPITNTYFPIDCVTSTIQELSDGSTVEVGLMGLEGFVGVQFWLGSPITPTRTIVQVEGRAYRMTSGDFRREIMEADSPLNRLCGGYTHAFLVMTSQTAACNRLHTVDERLCRWLKMVYDRVQRETFTMRQEFMAQMLGVHRPAVSIAANVLQNAGLIRYSRGNMEILNAEGLQEGACECYGIVDNQFNRLFGNYWRQLATD